MADKHSNTGIGFGSFLTLLFIGLKLTGYIHWSWWWVTAPMWIGALFALSILFFIAIIAMAAVVFETKK